MVNQRLSTPTDFSLAEQAAFFEALAQFYQRRESLSEDAPGAVIAGHGEGLPVVLGSPARRIDHRGRRLRVEMADGAVTAAASYAAPMRARPSCSVSCTGAGGDQGASGRPPPHRFIHHERWDTDLSVFYKQRRPVRCAVRISGASGYPLLSSPSARPLSCRQPGRREFAQPGRQRGLVKVRFTPKATEVLRCRKASLRAKTGREQMQQSPCVEARLTRSRRRR